MSIDFKKEVSLIKDEIIAIRRELHKIPETGTKLPNTISFISKKLTEWNIPHEVKKDISCIFLTIGKGEKCLLLRADVDALPGTEMSGLDFASTNGCMHACGHDLHASIMLGTCKVLKKFENELKVTVKILFQSGEETFEGAQLAIDNGILENPKVDAAFGMHVFAGQILNSLSFHDIFLGSCYGFKIDITGRGGHGSQPENCIDPINAGVEVYQALHALIARERPALVGVALTIGSFNAGQVANVIPNSCTLQGTLRAFDNNVREMLIRRINEITKDVCKAYRCEVNITTLSNVPSLVCDNELSEKIRKNIDSLNIISEYYPNKQFIGSEDFALIAAKVPSVYYAIGAGVDDKTKWCAQHNPKIVFNEEVIPSGIQIFTKVAFTS